jgi:Bcr/CflA subfamily drug resistance transporter
MKLTIENRIIAPSIPLIIVIAGLPQLSETIYTPALPDIAKTLMVPETMVEYTLSIYLLGFAIGSLFFGKISDKYGRRPCLLTGFVLYILGCIGCFNASSIEMLLASRFLQAFGGSVGSVLGQSISRDAFTGVARGKAFAAVGGALSFAPAIGPVIGGVIDQNFGWNAIFLFLIALGLLVWIAAYIKLPETHPKHNRTHFSLISLSIKMLKDRKILAYGFLVASGNGIIFSYYAEGSFYMIDLLGLSPSLYGMSFIVTAIAGSSGGFIGKKLHDYRNPYEITKIGLLIILFGSAIFSIATYILVSLSASAMSYIITTLGCTMLIMLGIGISIPSILSEALHDYHYATGSASALFGFLYYLGISFITFLMGLLHTGSLLTMPFYFLGISISMILVFYWVLSPSVRL